MNTFDFGALQKDIERASKQAFDEVAGNNKEETFCAFALYSDDGAMTVCPSMNTLSHLLHQQQGDPDSQAYFKYAPAEWHFESWGADEAFAQICTKVREEALRISDDDQQFRWFRDNLFETCIRALETLRRERFFESRGAVDLLLMFAVSDSDQSADAEVGRVARLNNPQVVAEFKAWTKTWAQ